MLPCDGYTSLFKLQSQAILLEDTASHVRAGLGALPRVIRDMSPYSVVPFQDSSWHRDHAQRTRPVAPKPTASAGIQRKPIETHAAATATRLACRRQQARARSHQARARVVCCCAPRVRICQFGRRHRSHFLLVHSPLLQQSRLLAVPPLSDMLKFGGSFRVRQVTVIDTCRMYRRACLGCCCCCCAHAVLWETTATMARGRRSTTASFPSSRVAARRRALLFCCAVSFFCPVVVVVVVVVVVAARGQHHTRTHTHTHTHTLPCRQIAIPQSSASSSSS